VTRAACLGIAHIQHAELDRPKIDPPAVIVDLFEADQFPGEALGEIPLRFTSWRGKARGDGSYRDAGVS